MLKAKIPVAGKIEEVNEKVLKNPKLLLTGSYEEVWILRLQPRNFLQNVRSLISGPGAKGWFADEMCRLRDLLTGHAALGEGALKTMSDGGIPVHGIGGLVDENNWELIKKEFFDS